LNPLDFPQDCAKPAPTQNENLADKPSCQHEYAYKMGLALGGKAGFNVADQLPVSDPETAKELAVFLGLQSCIPFQLTDDPDGNCRKFIQLYFWLHAVVDKHVNAVLQTLEESGQADNTIVIFLADHGEYAAAHGMMIEKWHTAYQEALHVPVVVRPLAAKASGGAHGAAPSGRSDHAVLRQIDAVTSHIDILPTVLGLAGVTGDERAAIARKLAERRPVPPLPGVDLTPLILGEWSPDKVYEPDGRERQGVLFITDDEITAPLPPSDSPQERRSHEEFQIYRAMVDLVREGRGRNPPVPMMPGSVKQPNHVRCVRTKHFKLARYIDPSGAAPPEWEMYDLVNDRNETTNLVETHVSPPTARVGVSDPPAVQEAADALAALLAALEKRDL
jgi:arylsulfatase A-like enzyme